ncbi:MAG: protein-export chaperone SecB [Pseudomonadota bacterium]
MPSGNGAAAEGAASQPQLNVLSQYVKDLSFENPNAPQALTTQQPNPKIEIGVNVNANPMGQDAFEVELAITAKAGSGEGEEASTLFAADLTYGGIFRLQNIPKDQLHPMVLIECPRILFPFARQIIAEATRNGGFPPLLLDPIDFVALYRQRAQQVQAAQAQKAADAPS